MLYSGVQTIPDDGAKNWNLTATRQYVRTLLCSKCSGRQRERVGWYSETWRDQPRCWWRLSPRYDVTVAWKYNSDKINVASLSCTRSAVQWLKRELRMRTVRGHVDGTNAMGIKKDAEFIPDDGRSWNVVVTDWGTVGLHWTADKWCDTWQSQSPLQHYGV
jgi:hypothetical protein